MKPRRPSSIHACLHQTQAPPLTHSHHLIHTPHHQRRRHQPRQTRREMTNPSPSSSASSLPSFDSPPLTPSPVPSSSSSSPARTTTTIATNKQQHHQPADTATLKQELSEHVERKLGTLRIEVQGLRNLKVRQCVGKVGDECGGMPLLIIFAITPFSLLIVLPISSSSFPCSFHSMSMNAHPFSIACTLDDSPSPSLPPSLFPSTSLSPQLAPLLSLDRARACSFFLSLAFSRFPPACIPSIYLCLSCFSLSFLLLSDASRVRICKNAIKLEREMSHV